MCGIVGYVGERNAVPLILEGLQRLEYRGYDSAGVAVLTPDGISTRKDAGRLSVLKEDLEANPITGSPCIGHTRWATHGDPTQINSHPHMDSSGNIAVVHNGIIENYQELRTELTKEGHVFKSETDSEIVPHLIERELKNGAPDFLSAVSSALAYARGAYALAILNADEPDVLYAARLGSPLIIGMGQAENFVASDVPAILKEVDRVIYLKEGEVARLTKSDITVVTTDGAEVTPVIEEITLEPEAADMAGFETFMLKEIHEQPRVLRGLLQKYLATPTDVSMELTGLDNAYLKNLRRVIIVSCGTAYYAGCYGKLLLEHFSNLTIETELASEFRYRAARFDENTLILSVSQSGETADTLASIRMAAEKGCKILSICNVRGSSVARESDAVLFTDAGPEIGVASTKAYTAQLMAFALLTLHLGRLRGEIAEDDAFDLVSHLRNIPNALHYVLNRKDIIQAIAEKHHDGPSSLYLGRRFNYPTAMEGALKNKEISYQHAEAYAAGEMKHGPIALINEYLPVICICTKTSDKLYEKMISNVREVEARHGRIIAIATDGDELIRDLTDNIIYVPETSEECSPMVNVVALQLLAYYSAHARGTDIDKPRNLAKSVTVE